MLTAFNIIIPKLEGLLSDSTEEIEITNSPHVLTIFFYIF